MANRIKTNEQYILDSIAVHGTSFDYSYTKYIKSSEKVTIKCNACGNIFEQNASDHLSGRGCPICAGVAKLTIKTFVEKSNIVHDYKFNYDKVHNFKNNKEKVIIICPQHGEFIQVVNNHMRGYGCKSCRTDLNTIILKKDINLFKEEANKVHNFLYDYSKVEYKQSHINIEIICKVHGSFFQTPSNHLKGYGCKMCSHNKIYSNSPLEELVIKDYLINNNIIFEEQKIFNNCKYKSHLKFDFYILSHNMCIEYNGEQHYRPFRFEKDSKTFKIRKIRDDIKIEYCNKNNINLLIIPYWDFKKVENILKNKLNI